MAVVVVGKLRREIRHWMAGSPCATGLDCSPPPPPGGRCAPWRPASQTPLAAPQGVPLARKKSRDTTLGTNEQRSATVNPDDDLDPVARRNREDEQQQLELAELDRHLDRVGADHESDPLREMWFGDSSE